MQVRGLTFWLVHKSKSCWNTIGRKKALHAWFGIREVGRLSERDGWLLPDIVSGDYFMVLRAPIVQYFDGFFHASVNSVGVEAVLRQQQLGLAVGHDAIAQPHAHGL